MKFLLYLFGGLLFICYPAQSQNSKGTLRVDQDGNTFLEKENGEREPVDKTPILIHALNSSDYETVLMLTENDPKLQAFRVDTLHNRGVQRFFQANIKGAVEDFDQVVKIEPKRDAHHWQRGIAYYYDEAYQLGKEQFERHQTVNNQDVENAVWHFLCSVRTPEGSVESARKQLIEITKDERVPMKQIHALFAGKGSPESVLKAAKRKGNPEKDEIAKNAMLYAHLYLGLYYEATGEEAKMQHHIAQAIGPYKMHHYMGKVAQVHAKLRGIKYQTSDSQ